MTDRPQRPDQKPELAASSTPVGIVLDLVQEKNVELTPREIAEIVWIGVRWSAFDISPPEPVIAPSPSQLLDDDVGSEQRDSEERQENSEEMEEAFQGEADEKGPEEQAEDRLSGDVETESTSKTGSWQRTRINLPQLPALDNPLSVSRALHRLARTREAPGRPVINVPLTVQRTASSGIYQLVLEPSSLRLLTLAAAIPGRVDIELLRSLGQAFGVTTTGYSLAEAMTAGFLECSETTADRRVVMRFANEEARRSLLQYIERDEVPRVLDFLINSYGPGTAAEADIHFGRQHLQLPLDVLTHTLHPEKAEAFFLEGMTQAMRRLAERAHPAFPVTIYYAFKQSENQGNAGIASTGWETFLDAVIRAGFAISGTWPMRTERTGRMRDFGSNALASSIVIVCRPRVTDAPVATRREFLSAVKAELPVALAHLQRGNIAPVDLAQAAIGPGMAVYTRYARVLDAEGKPLPVREALALINQTLDEALAEQDGDFDADSRWALAWFEQLGFLEGEYGLAETLSKAKNTSVSGMTDAGILASKGGKVRLLRPDELPADWNPEKDNRLTAWEAVHQLIRVLEAGGESAAAALAARLGSNAEIARELAYRLYTLCERKKRAAEALSYNGLVQSWPEITRLACEEKLQMPVQRHLFRQDEQD